MVIAGNDPTGGAGISADIESVISQGCHPLPVVSCLTIQDTCDVIAIEPVDAGLLSEQARCILEDMPVDVIKLGLLGSEDNIEAVREILLDYPDIPMVLDPVLAAGGGETLASTATVDAMKELLLEFATIITPNTDEAIELAAVADNAQAAIPALFEFGCEWVLLTGTHESNHDVINRLYDESGLFEEYSWQRLKHTYHGSGCTLASAIAALIARGLEIPEAVLQAQEFTWHSLQQSHRLGMGQLHPNRLFWAEQERENNDA